MIRFPLALASLLVALLFGPAANGLAVEDAEQMGRDAVAAHAAGDLATAEATLAAALGLLGQDGDSPILWQEDGEAWSRRTRLYLLRELADLRLTQGRPQEAQVLLQEARVLAAGDKAEEAHVWNQQGLADWLAGDLGKAHMDFTLARVRYDSLGEDQAAQSAMVRGNLGLVQLDSFTAGGPSSLLGAAEARFTEARDGFLDLGQKEGLANQWANLGLVYGLQGRLEEAERAHGEALALERSLDNHIGEIDTLGSLGLVAEKRGDTVKAEALYVEAFELAQAVGYARGISHHGLYLAVLFIDQGNWAQAKRFGGPALEAARSIGAPQTIGGLLVFLARASVALGDCDDAQDRLAELFALDGATGVQQEAVDVFGTVLTCKPPSD